MTTPSRPPLTGIRVVEFAGMGPTPFCGMVLADLGATVVRVDQPKARGTLGMDYDVVNGRGKQSIVVDLKASGGLAVAQRLLDGADVCLEGYRPGVAERLGIGPDDALARNPRLVYARGTGWGQDGPLARAAGHDIVYLALCGALQAMGPPDGPPSPPLNLVGDYGGGGMLQLVGVLAALFERHTSGLGQVVDAAMVDGSALLMTAMFEQHATGDWHNVRGRNFTDGGAPFYGTFETADGRFIAIGAVEDPFYAELLRVLDLDAAVIPDRADRSAWPELRRLFASVFRTRTRDEWVAKADGHDACLAPVLDIVEAPGHPHNAERGSYARAGDAVVPVPAPRFSRTPALPPGAGPARGEDTDAVLEDAGYAAGEVTGLRAAGAVA